MSRFVFISLALVAALLAVDYYVYRHWRRYVRLRSRHHSGIHSLRWTLPLYQVLMPLMAVSMPVYFAFSNWWEVEPKLARALFMGIWVTYYLPKALLALALLVKDGIRFVIWLFGWFQERLLAPAEVPASAPAEGPAEVPAPAPTPTAEARLDLSDMKRMRRREFVQRLGWSAATVPFVVVGYGVFKSLYDFQVFRVDVPIRDLPRALDGLTVAQLSDLHAGSFFSERPMHEAVSIVESLRPDLIAITGDFVNHDADELPLILPALNRLRAPLGVYGCPGNHDHYARIEDVVRGVRSTPVDLLVNQHRTLRVDGARLHVIGTDNTGFRQRYADLPGALDGLQADPHGEEVRLLLAHDPTFWDAHVRPGFPEIDLMLCGHTHGGQIGFEVGPLRWGLARVAYARWAGLYAEARATGAGRQFLYVNRGAGTVGPPLRLGIRPEITLLTLRRA
ncbi:MAG: metallophosphoesterase [Bacteroidetes bacterium]|nr:MAG: metallophosphoesterase [Bacteroidota bacterium]